VYDFREMDRLIMEIGASDIQSVVPNSGESLGIREKTKRDEDIIFKNRFNGLVQDLLSL
jgi:hypothetical protein